MFRPSPTQPKPSLAIAFGLAIIALLWEIFARYVVPLVIASAYQERSLPFLNHLILGRASHPLAAYVSDWADLQVRLLGYLLFMGVFTLVVTRPEVARMIWGREPERLRFFTTQDRGRSGKRRWLGYSFSFLLYLVFAVLATLPASLHLTGVLLGEGWDNYQQAWFVWEFARAVIHLHSPFYTDLIYYPFGANLAWATLDPLAGLMALPLSLSVGPVLAYNLSILLQMTLSAFFARLLFLRLSGDAKAATIGGIIFGFSPFMLAHALDHLFLVMAFSIPLYVLALDGILENEKPSWKEGVYLGLALLATALSNYEYTVFCILFTFVVVLIDLARGPAAFLRRTWMHIFVSASTFVLSFSPILALLLKGGLRNTRGLGEIEYFSADLADFFVPSPYSSFFGKYVAPMREKLFAFGIERIVFIGITTLALAVVGFWSAQGRERRWAGRGAVAGLFFAILVLGPTVHFLGEPINVTAPGALFYRVSFMRFLREPGRMSVMVMFCFALLATFGVASLSAKLKQPWQKAALICLVCLGLAIEYSVYPFPGSSIVDPRYYADKSITSQICTVPQGVRDATVLTIPLLQPDTWKRPMWMQIMDGGRYRILDGYAAPYVPAHLWTEFDQTPIVGSLRHTPTQPLLAKQDRPYADFLRRKLNLGAVVVFDAPERTDELSYVRQVFGGKETLVGSCAVFELKTSN